MARVHRCVVRDCNYVTGGLFHFPINDDVRKKWLDAIPNLQSVFPQKTVHDIPYSTLKHYAVCSSHFETCKFQTYERKKLLRGAIPTIFLYKADTPSSSPAAIVAGTSTDLAVECSPTPLNDELSESIPMTSEPAESADIQDIDTIVSSDSTPESPQGCSTQMIRPRHKNKTCFYPKCKSGYASTKERVSVFVAPKESFEEWKKIIPRTDRTFSPRDVVCEKHFYKDDIVQEWKSGDISVPLRRKRLKPDALPSPDHDDRRCLTPKGPVKRRLLLRHKLPVTKINSPPQIQAEDVEQADPEIVPETVDDPFEELLRDRHFLELPDGWGVHSLKESLMLTEYQLQDSDKPPIEKSSIAQLSDLQIKGVTDVDKLVDIFMNSHFCVGGPKVKAFPQSEVNSRVAHVDSSGRWRHEMCTIISQSGCACIYCNSLHSTFQHNQIYKKIAENKRLDDRRLRRYRAENNDLKLLIQVLRAKLDEKLFSNDS